jgi:opacity protein-like surface antigen
MGVTPDSGAGGIQTFETAELEEIDRQLNNPLNSLLSMTSQNSTNLNTGDAVGDEGWEISLAPYMWAIAANGEATIQDLTVDIDVPFSDIVKKLNFGLMGRAEVRRGRWFGVFDGMGAQLTDEISAGPVEASFGPVTVSGATAIGPGGGGTVAVGTTVSQISAAVGPVDVEVDTRLLLFGLYGGYRLVSTPVAKLLGEADDQDARRLHVDLFAGARYWNIKMEAEVFIPPVSVSGFTVSPSLQITGPGARRLDLEGEVQVPGVTVGGLRQEFETTLDWVDAVVGTRVMVYVHPRVQLIATGDVGGFGIGSAADLTWQAIGGFGWRLSDSWSLQLGYRAIGIDLDRGANRIDMVAHGPLLGAIWTFRP